MFTKAFGLKSHPFEENISTEKAVHDKRFFHALGRLDYFAEHGQIALLTGSTGVGKTLLLSCFLETLPTHLYQPINPSISSVEPPAMLRMIASALGEKPSLGKDRLFRQIINKTQSSGRITLIIVDDAHLLSEATLIDLRLLISSCQKNNSAPIKLFLSGQSSLSKQLTHSSLADLLNRVNIRCSLPALNQKQSINYMNYRLKHAGGAASLFDEPAKALIHDHTGGIPRGINNLATTCLLHAASQGVKTIGQAQVIESANELRII